LARKQAKIEQAVSIQLTAEDIRSGLNRLRKRLDELKELATINSLPELESKCREAVKVIDGNIARTFGRDTAEYDLYKIQHLYSGGTIVFGRTVPNSEHVSAYHRGIGKAIETLTAAAKDLSEQLEEMGATNSGRALKAYEGLELHNEIDRAAGGLFRDGHYANAISTAVIALNDFVRLRSGIADKDGTTLMEFVFSPKSPVLKFNDLQDESDRNEQKGFMMMFSGAVAGLRNPRAHKIIKDDPEEALEFIAFISLLAKLVDKAKKA
jgi:uncharacterized protein (TIGR02391 family)